MLYDFSLNKPPSESGIPVFSSLRIPCSHYFEKLLVRLESCKCLCIKTDLYVVVYTFQVLYILLLPPQKEKDMTIDIINMCPVRQDSRAVGLKYGAG